jgi:hypothetical protein
MSRFLLLSELLLGRGSGRRGRFLGVRFFFLRAAGSGVVRQAVNPSVNLTG